MDADYASVRPPKNDGKTLRETAGVLGVSPERLTQLPEPNKRCPLHGICYIARCSRCAWKDRVHKAISRIERDDLMAEIQELAARDRRRETVVRRKALVEKLHNVYGLSLNHIGTLLNRDHSSIVHLYHKR